MAPWALQGPGPARQRPPGPFKGLGPGSCEPPWALVGPPWALAGWALVGRAVVGHALLGPHGPLWALGFCGPGSCGLGPSGPPGPGP